jgi:hypothetical protein
MSTKGTQLGMQKEAIWEMSFAEILHKQPSRDTIVESVNMWWLNSGRSLQYEVSYNTTAPLNHIYI